MKTRRAGLFLPLRVDSGRDGRTGWEPFGGWGRLGKPLTCARSLAIEGGRLGRGGKGEMECSDSTRETCKTKSKRKKRLSTTTFPRDGGWWRWRGVVLVDDGGGKEREREKLWSQIFFALGEVQWADGHTRQASQPAGERAIKGFGWLSLFFWAGKAPAWGFASLGLEL